MAVYPAYTAGQRLTAALLTSMQTQEVVKVANETVTSSTTLQDDDELTFPVVANASYDIEFCIRFAGLNAAGLKTAWSVPSGTSGLKLVSGPGSANATEANANTTEMRWAVHATSTVVNYTDPRNSASSQTFAVERSRLDIAATPGDVTLQWAQLASNGTGTVVALGSYVRYRRVA